MYSNFAYLTRGKWIVQGTSAETFLDSVWHSDDLGEATRIAAERQQIDGGQWRAVRNKAFPYDKHPNRNQEFSSGSDQR